MTQTISEDERSDDWLAQLRNLASELEAGMNAVAANQVVTFRQCVERQQLLCRQMSSRAAAQSSGRPVDRPDAGEWSQQMRTAAETLRRLNDRYASLLRHSGRALRMFSALEHSGEYYLPAVPGAALTRKARRPSWSCEG